ncbi:CD209 antigen-like protein C [Brienomyrus brachyistius]|uniref:CD209 antigen-like protein C n=1 Tax=Brienomyrus brachyistius TaxID=42636 RepID=UPI0020B3308B|nr:CD209 antigen-like protein C [Brienomyrus brachyistius]
MDMDLDQHIYVNGISLKRSIIAAQTLKNPGARLSGSESAGRRDHRPAAVCLGLLCFLLLSALTALAVYHIGAINDAEKKQQVLAAERDQILSNHSVLSAERDQLEDAYTSCNHIKNQLVSRICPKGWSLDVSINCYYVSTGIKNWSDSREDCRKKGADLVIIRSPQEQAFIENLKGSFWIGLIKNEEGGTWKWVDGKAASTNNGYWNPGQPDNHQGIEKCVESNRFHLPTHQKGWNDLPCQNKMPWICQKQPSGFQN